MIIIIRGHIRNSFDSQLLFNFVNELNKTYSDLKIYIHTWSIYSNSISHREINENKTQVTDTFIYNYFKDLSHLIKHIIIDDDTNIQLIGNISGNINNGGMPIIGWKNYLYGQYQIVNYVYNLNKDNNEPIINTRFDLFNNSNNFSHQIFKFFKKPLTKS